MANGRVNKDQGRPDNWVASNFEQKLPRSSGSLKQGVASEKKGEIWQFGAGVINCRSVLLLLHSLLKASAASNKSRSNFNTV